MRDLCARDAEGANVQILFFSEEVAEPAVGHVADRVAAGDGAASGTANGPQRSGGTSSRSPRCGGCILGFLGSNAENFAPPVSPPPKVPARFLGVQMLAHDYGPNGLAILPSSVWEEGIAWRSSRVPSG